MAVTQQLARLTSEQLVACRSSLTAINDLCSFRMLVADDHLDLNWAGTMLQGMAAIGVVETEFQLGLTLSLDGAEEVNPGYREVLYSIWEHPVTSLSPDQVREVAELLARLADSGFPSEQDVKAYFASRPDWGWQGPYRYFPQKLAALRTFYADAASRGLCTALWWD